MAMGSYLSIINLNVSELNAPTKRQRLAEWIQKQDPYICCLQETHLKTRATYRLNGKGWKKIFYANGDQKKPGVAILISDKIDFKIKTVKRDKEDCIMVKGSIQEEDITIRNIYAPFPGGSEVIIVFACKVGDPGSIPGLGRSPEEGNGNPLQYSCLENGQRSLAGYSS